MNPSGRRPERRSSLADEGHSTNENCCLFVGHAHPMGRFLNHIVFIERVQNFPLPLPHQSYPSACPHCLPVPALVTESSLRVCEGGGCGFLRIMNNISYFSKVLLYHYFCCCNKIFIIGVIITAYLQLFHFYFLLILLHLLK